MRVVIDTNVLVSGLLSADGPCGRIVALLAEEVFVLCLDGRILGEYEEVLPRPQFRIDPEDVGDALELIRLQAERFTPLPLPADLPDPDDLPFLEVAAAAEAILVTGNTRHFPKSACGSVRVLSPRDLLEVLSQRP